MEEEDKAIWIEESDPSHHSVQPVDVTDQEVHEALSVLVAMPNLGAYKEQNQENLHFAF
jgi:hypothetical protein